MSAIRLANTDPDDIPTPPTDRMYLFLDLAGSLNLKDQDGVTQSVGPAFLATADPGDISVEQGAGTIVLALTLEFAVSRAGSYRQVVGALDVQMASGTVGDDGSPIIVGLPQAIGNLIGGGFETFEPGGSAPYCSVGYVVGGVAGLGFLNEDGLHDASGALVTTALDVGDQIRGSFAFLLAALS